MSKNQFVILIIFCIFSAKSLAAEYQLFLAPNEPALEYNQMVDRLTVGDIVKFSDGQAMTIDQLVGHGNSHLIFAAKEFPDQVVRIPYRAGKMPTIWQYVEGEKLLKEMSIAHPQVIANYQNEWIRTERLNQQIMTFDQFIEFYKPKLFGFINNDKVESQDYQIAIYELKKFAKSIAMFGRIGDFHSGNLVYDPVHEKWIIIDWHEMHKLATSVEQSSPFDHFVFEFGTLIGRDFTPKKREYQFLQSVFTELVDIIRAERFIQFTQRRCESVFNQ